LFVLQTLCVLHEYIIIIFIIWTEETFLCCRWNSVYRPQWNDWSPGSCAKPNQGFTKTPGIK